MTPPAETGRQRHRNAHRRQTRIVESIENVEGDRLRPGLLYASHPGAGSGVAGQESVFDSGGQYLAEMLPNCRDGARRELERTRPCLDVSALDRAQRAPAECRDDVVCHAPIDNVGGRLPRWTHPLEPGRRVARERDLAGARIHVGADEL